VSKKKENKKQQSFFGTKDVKAKFMEEGIGKEGFNRSGGGIV